MKQVTLLGFGYLGFNLYRHLIRSGYQVRIISPETWYTSRIDETAEYIHLPFECLGKKSVYYGMLEDYILDDVPLVYAVGNINTTQTLAHLESEFTGMYTDFFYTVKICNTKKVSNFIFFSSGGTIYGNKEKQYLKETDVPDPVNIYGLQKLCFEQILKINHAEGGCPYLITRISNPYGGVVEPGREQGLIPVVLRKLALNDVLETWVPHTTTRDYVHMADMCNIIMALIRKGIHGDVFNVGSGCGVSNQDIFDTCEKITGNVLRLKPVYRDTALIPRNVLDIKKISDEDCYFSDIPLEQGVKALNAAILNHAANEIV